MEPASRDPLEREQARRRRAQQVQRRRLVLGIGVLGLIVLIAALAVALSGGSNTTDGTTSTEPGETTTSSLLAATYTADLTGDQSVPPVTTQATGTLTLNYNPDDSTLSFSLEIDGLTNPSVATVYEGAAGASGTAVLTLFAGPTKEGRYVGVLADGTIEDSDLTGSLAGETIAELITLIQAGNAYVSVGNTSHPVDAVRGQIE